MVNNARGMNDLDLESMTTDLQKGQDLRGRFEQDGYSIKGASAEATYGVQSSTEGVGGKIQNRGQAAKARSQTPPAQAIPIRGPQHLRRDSRLGFETKQRCCEAPKP